MSGVGRNTAMSSVNATNIAQLWSIISMVLPTSDQLCKYIWYPSGGCELVKCVIQEK